MPGRFDLPPPVAKAWRWWSAELAAMLPPGMRRRLARRRARVLLARDEVLVRRAVLPLATEENLREVIAFEMDRVLPFQADEVCFDFAVRARDRAQNRLTVEIVAARRAAVEALVAAEGGTVHGIGVEGLDETFDLCPPGARHRRLRRADMAMAGLGCLLLLSAAAVPFVRAEQRILRLEGEIEAIRTEAAEAEALRRDVDAALAAERAIVEARLARPIALSGIEEISRLSPDDSWLQQVRLSAEGVEMQGVAAASAQLLRAIEDSPMFSAAAFRAPVTQDGQGNRERFSLGARWEGAAR